jgi:hypothetical protein
VLLAACDREPRKPQYRVIGEAFAGPADLPLHEDINPRSAITIHAKHGEKLEIIERRRRFYQVRTSSQQIGWTDGRNLLTEEQLNAIRRLAERFAEAPSLGTATVYEEVNLHNDPNRQAPSFYIIKKQEKVEILGFLRTPREAYPPLQLEIDTKPKPAPRPKKKKKASKNAYELPLPQAPGLPPNYEELSRSLPREEPAPESAPASNATIPAPAAPPPITDNWALTRASNGAVGWALSSLVILDLPDEVLQLAGGQRIVEAHRLGETITEEGNKPEWVWSTRSKDLKNCHFDAMRAFAWNARYKRYDMVLREREMCGFHPIIVEREADSTRFRLNMVDSSGSVIERSYQMKDRRVTRLASSPTTLKADALLAQTIPGVLSPQSVIHWDGGPPPPSQRSLLDATRKKLEKLLPGR